MRLSINWIKSFVSIPNGISDQEIARKITMSTAEVESILRESSHFKSINVAIIKGVRKHPGADRLNLVRIGMGGKEEKEVICGASNVREGLRVAFVPPGVTLPNGLTLVAKTIKGIRSEGMLCSEMELGLGKDTCGIMELPENVELGDNLLSALNLDEDIILEIDNKSLTHRPDLWGHYGFARECSAIWRKDLANPFELNWQKSLEKYFKGEKSPICPQVDKKSSCLSYWALSVQGIEVGESPIWMQNRLKSCGMRPINSIVDISNYVMLELGIPNHIFDLNHIQGDIISVGLSEKDRKFMTLDLIERDLKATDTLIFDSKAPLAIAGIMGGLNSGVIAGTNKILIEVANWKASCVRNTSQRLGLRTESSQRYEKTLDTHLCYQTLLRILELVLELHPRARVMGKPEWAGSTKELGIPRVFQPLEISCEFSKIIETSLGVINRYLGEAVEPERVFEILKYLGFTVKRKGEKIFVGVPSYRSNKDVESEADLVEEVGRIIGYDKITPRAPMVVIQPKRLSPLKIFHRKNSRLSCIERALS